MTLSADGKREQQILLARSLLAQKVAQLRDDANLSQRQAARAAGIAPATWSRLERSEHDPSLGQVLRVQRLFGLDSIESFFGPGATARILAGDPEPPVESNENG